MENSFEYVKNNAKLRKLKEKQLLLRESFREELKEGFSKYYSDFKIQYDWSDDIFRVIFNNNIRKYACIKLYNKYMDLSVVIEIYRNNDLEVLKKCVNKFKKDFIIIVRNI